MNQLLAALALFAPRAAFCAAPEVLPEFRDVHYADLSPDGSQVVFSYQGDLWTADVEEGVARRLTVHEAYESRPRFSPDGRTIAFISDRYGNSDIFLIPAVGGTVERVTYHSADDILADWSPDGRKLLFNAAGRDHDYTTPYEIEIETGYVHPLLRDCCGVNATGYSPDGRFVAGIRRGTAWWRKGYRGSANSQVMIYDTEQDTMRIVTDFAGMDNWPLFSADGRQLCYVSEREGRPNLFRHDLESGEIERMTRFDEDAVTFPSLSGDGRYLVFEWSFGLYRLRTEHGAPTKISLRGPLDYRQSFESEETLTGDIQEMEVNRDGGLVAIRLRDDIFFVRPELKHDSIRITEWPGPDGDYFWSPDGKTLAYISQQNGTSDIWVADAETHETRCLVRDDEYYLDMISYTRDGTRILFRHNAGGDGVWAADAETGEVSRFLADPDVEDVAISPDERWVLAQISDARSGTDLSIKPLEGGEWVNVTQHPDGNWGCHWSPDGKKIFFVSRRDGNAEIYSIDLQRQSEEFEDYEAQLKEKEEQEKPAQPKPEPQPEPQPQPEEGAQQEGAGEQEAQPAEGEEGEAEEAEPQEEAWKPPTIEPFEIDFERIWERAKRLTETGEDEGNIMLTPDGKTVIFTRGGQIWAMDPDGKNQRQYVPGDFELSYVRLQGDGGAIFLVDDGKLKKAPGSGGGASDIDWQAKLERDQRVLQRQAFEQGWALLDEQFYAASLHGTDWRAMRDTYGAMCDGTLVREDFHHLVARMIGELDASHLDIYGGGGRSGPVTAYLGIRADPQHRGPGIRVAEVIPDGPVDKPESSVAVGEYILTVNGEPVDNSEHLYELLNGRIGERMKLQVNGEPTLEGAREVSVKPISGGEWSRLFYERWVRNNREIALRLSDGRVYYAHIAGMDGGSAERFERELWGAAQHHDAIIIDVRNNGGGSTHDRLLEMLTKKVHGWAARRSTPPRPSPSPQFDGPKALLINEYSSSDAEIFPNAFREKHLGPLIGMPTNGSVIGTYDVTLVDGSGFRVPVVGWFTMEGMNLENYGVPPDIEVPYPYEDFRSGRDPQIAKAVEVLLQALAEAKPAQPPPVQP